MSCNTYSNVKTYSQSCLPTQNNQSYFCTVEQKAITFLPPWSNFEINCKYSYLAIINFSIYTLFTGQLEINRINPYKLLKHSWTLKESRQKVSNFPVSLISYAASKLDEYEQWVGSASPSHENPNQRQMPKTIQRQFKGKMRSKCNITALSLLIRILIIRVMIIIQIM